MQVIPVMPFVATYVLLLQTAAFSSKLVRLVYRTSHSLRITQKSGVVLAPTGDFVRRDLYLKALRIWRISSGRDGAASIWI